MITPEKMKSYEKNKIVDLYTKLNQDLTNEIIKKLKKTGDISSYTRAQIRQLARQGGKEMFKMALKRVLSLSKKQKSALRELLLEIENESLKGYKHIKADGGKEVIISPSMVKLTNNIYRRTNKELKNFSKTVAYSTNKTYVKAVDELFLKVSSGSKDYASALKSTINDLSKEGVTLTSKGRNYRLESTVKMNLMTSLTQVANEMSEDIGKQIDANCVAIGHSPFCRPTHRVIDGVIMSLEKFKKYEYLTKEPNCYHIVNYDWREEFEGTTAKVKNNGHLTSAEYSKNYKNRQEQNYLARQVRYKKQEIASIKNSDSELLRKKKQELSIAQTKYRTYSKSKNLDVDYNSTWVAGYNK